MYLWRKMIWIMDVCDYSLLPSHQKGRRKLLGFALMVCNNLKFWGQCQDVVVHIILVLPLYKSFELWGIHEIWYDVIHLYLSHVHLMTITKWNLFYRFHHKAWNCWWHLVGSRTPHLMCYFLIQGPLCCVCFRNDFFTQIA
jgi:hypothetical protein